MGDSVTDDEVAEMLAVLIREGRLRYWCSCSCTLSDHANSKAISGPLADEFYQDAST